MFSEFSIVKNVFDDSEKLLHKYLGDERTQKLKSDIDQKMSSNKPVVMVYGVYNAGKSSLINALVGSVVAEEGDVPKTDKVDVYQYENFEILDTPGIDAPIAHEDVSREQLVKSDAILFVLSSDGIFDEKSTFDEIYKIVNAGKPVLAVINNKSGYKETDNEYHSIVDKFKSNLVKLAESGVEDKVSSIPVLLVNAKSALKAKQENKSKLLERSNISVLETEVQRLFEKTDKKQQLATIKSMLDQELCAAREKAELQLSDTDAKNITKLIGNISESKQALVFKLKKYVKIEEGALQSNILTMLGDGQTIEVQSYLESWQEKFNQYFTEQLSKTVAQVGVDAENLVSHIPALTSGVPLEGELICADEGNSSGIEIGKLLGLGRQLKVGDEMMKQGIIKSLELGKSAFPSIFKGIGPITMRKYAERMIPFVGPAISIVTGIYDFYKAKREEDKLIAQERNRMERVKEYAERLVRDVTDNVMDVAFDEVDTVFSPVVKQLEEQLNKASEQHGSVKDDVGHLFSITERLAKVA